MPRKPAVRRTFDRDFFERYYLDTSTAVMLRDEVHRLARFVTSYLDFLGIELDSVLDAGCGTGMWRGALKRIDPRIEYTGIDVSEYLCRRYGWTQSSIAEFRSRRKFDLVIVQDMLQYLDGEEVDASIDRVAALCRGAVYVDVPTREDFREGALDLRRTDRNIHVRSVAWYRRRLDRYFTSAGGGVFIPRGDRTRLLALERG